MADLEQLALLTENVEAWNAWRKQHPDVVIDLKDADLRHSFLQRANLHGAHLENANLANCVLKKANLSSAHLQGACLAFADLEQAVLVFARCAGADFRVARLARAVLEDADLEGADLSHADLNGAVLASAGLKHANLTDCRLHGVNMAAANLENANVSQVSYDRQIFLQLLKRTGFNFQALWRQRYDCILDSTIRCKGVNAASCYGSQRFKLFLQDQDYLEEFLETRWGRRICFLWWLSADCGRSLSRWAGWSIAIAMIFACIYHLLGPNSFASEHLRLNFWNTVYYSVVTFTTLGFGDITPRNTTAAMVVMVEVIIGYVMLGGLITIFASKLSRRGG